ncbi:MAG: type II secretion system F family protein [Acidobacteriota bacterium]
MAWSIAVGALAATSYQWYVWRTRGRVLERLAEMIAAAGVADREPVSHRPVRPFPPRYRWLAPTAGVTVGVLLWLAAGVPLGIAAAIGVLLAVLSSMAEAHIAEQKEAFIETQLAAAIDLLIGSVRAGSALLAAFESALEEAEPPIRPYLQEVAGRIKLGDDPRAAVGDLQARVPLETFRLFATSLAIHWEVGGSLATTLSTVGRTIRDRIELSRQVRAQGVEAHASVAVVLVLSYVLAFLMWRTNPDRLGAFVGSAIGTALVAGVIGLQAVGLIWMSRLSRSRF